MMSKSERYSDKIMKGFATVIGVLLITIITIQLSMVI